MTDAITQDTATGKEPLPVGWIWSEIGSVAELVRGVSYKKSDASTSPGPDLLPILRANNIGDGRLNFDEFVYVPPQAISEKQYIRALDVVIAMSSGSKKLVGKAGQAVGDFDGGFGAFCGLVRSSGLLDKRYIGLFFQSEIYRKAISELSSGVNINNLRRQHIEEMPLPLAPLNEQRRIVEKVEELFTKLDAGVRSLEQTQALLKSYRRSVLKAAVEGELSREWREAHGDEIEPASELLERILQERRKQWESEQLAKMQAKGKVPKNDKWKQTYDEPEEDHTVPHLLLPDGWTRVSLRTLLSLKNGINFNKSQRGGEGYPTVDVLNMYSEGIFIDTDSLYRVDKDIAEDYLLRYGDVLFVRSSVKREGVGWATAFKPTSEPVTYCGFIIRGRPQTAQIIPEYVTYYLRTEFARQTIIESSSQVTITNINQNSLGRIPIPVPPLEEQRLIVEEVERRLSVVDKLEATVEENLKQAEGLRQSILKQAFSGELVPQDPDDEPASVLLKRIREEREAAKPKARKGRKSDATPTKRNHAEQEGLF